MSISAGALWARENDIFFHDYGDNYFVLLVDGNRDTIVGSIGPSINSEMIVSYLAPLFHHLGENVPLHKSMIDYITHKINQRKIAYAGRWTQSRVNKIILIDRTNDFGLCMKYLIENAYNQLQKEFCGDNDNKIDIAEFISKWYHYIMCLLVINTYGHYHFKFLLQNGIEVYPAYKDAYQLNLI